LVEDIFKCTNISFTSGVDITSIVAISVLKGWNVKEVFRNEFLVRILAYLG